VPAPAEDPVREARVLAGLGRRDEARALLDEALGADPDDPAALVLKGAMLAEDRDWMDALAVYERAARRAPRSAEVRNELARCLHAVGRDEDALVEAEAARALLGEGDNFRFAAPVYLTLVWCLRELRRFREALAAAEEGLERAPDAILAQWATLVEGELVEAEKEQC
jgi:tetratricopeptide (TPR) repeat protein